MRGIKQILILSLILPTINFALEAELIPIGDAYICDCLPDDTNPNGGPTHLYQGQYGTCFDRTLIQWDLSEIGNEQTIVTAEIRLWCFSVFGTPTGNPAYYRITGSWNEGTVTYNTEPEYTTDGMVTTGWPTSGTWHIVDITDFVNGWYIGTYDNYGVYCHSIDTTGTGGAGYYSKDSDDSQYWPVLYVHYTNSAIESESLGTIKSTFR